MGNYAYVSLFGVNSINELTSQILQSTVMKHQIGDVPSFATVAEVITSAEKTVKKGILKALPFGGNHLASSVVTFLGITISKQIICVDDMERKGEKLSINDLLGYLSLLKEEKGCKIAILFNKDGLSEIEKVQFDTYIEKVADKNILFQPTPDECASIAIPGTDEMSVLLRQRVVQLGIDNIRVIKKISNAVEQLLPLLSQYSERTVASVVSMTALMGWVHYQPSVAPSVEFLTNYANRQWSNSEENLNEEEASKEAVLKRFEFSHLDELDMAIYHGIANGYFTQEIIDSHASDLHQRVLREQAEQRHREAWDNFRYSFKNGEQSVIGVADSFVREVEYLSVETLNSVVELLRDTSHHEQASRAIDAYITQHGNEPDKMNSERVYIHNGKLDAEIAERFDAALAQREVKRTLLEILTSKSDFYDDETVSDLISFSSQDIFDLITQQEGENLRTILSALHNYQRTRNPTSAMLTIRRRYGEALQKVAGTSEINRAKIQWLGIKIDELLSATKDEEPV